MEPPWYFCLVQSCVQCIKSRGELILCCCGVYNPGAFIDRECVVHTAALWGPLWIWWIQWRQILTVIVRKGQVWAFIWHRSPAVECYDCVLCSWRGWDALRTQREQTPHSELHLTADIYPETPVSHTHDLPDRHVHFDHLLFALPRSPSFFPPDMSVALCCSSWAEFVFFLVDTLTSCDHPDRYKGLWSVNQHCAAHSAMFDVKGKLLRSV